ncbi:MAG: tetratricopeptide repeat protein [Chloroflexota bacterium]
MFQSHHHRLFAVFSMLLLSVLACGFGASHLERARDAAESGRTETALEQYTLALEDDPSATDQFAIYSERGDVNREAKNVEAALSDYEAALTITDEDGASVGDHDSIYNRRLGVFLENELWDELVAEMDMFLETDPDNYEALARRGYAHMNLGNTQAAIDDLKASLAGGVEGSSDDLDSKGNLITLYNELAQAAVEVGENKAAADHYSELLALTDDEAKTLEILSARAAVYSELGVYDNVVADLNIILESQPNNYEALARRGYAHLQLRNFEAAIDDLKASLQGDIEAASDDLDNKRNLISAYYDLAQATVDLGEYETGIEYYDEALALAETENDNVEILTARGFAYSEMADQESALRDLNEAIELDPSMALAYAYRSYIYGDQGDHEAAISDASKAVELGNDLSDSRLGTIIHARAVAYLSTDQYEQAIADATESIRLVGTDSPDTARTYNVRGRAYRYMGDYSNAIADATTAIELGATDVVALDSFYRNRAYSHYLQEDDPNALSDIEAAISLNLEDPVAYDFDLVGRIHYAMGDYQSALEGYQQALALVADDPWIYKRLGDAYYELDDFDKAATEYKAAMELDPDELTFSDNLGLTLNFAGQPEAALEVLLQSAEAGSDNPWIYNAIGDIYYDQDDLENAEIAYRAATEVDPEWAYFHENLGFVLRLTEQYEEAVVSYSEALNLDPERPFSWFGRGMAYYFLVQDPQAIADFEMALKFDIDDDFRAFVEEKLAEIQ